MSHFVSTRTYRRGRLSMEVISQQVPIMQLQTSPKKVVRALIIAGAGALIATKLYALFLLADTLISIYTFLTTFLIFSSFIITYTMYKDPVLSKKRGLSRISSP